MRNKNKNCHPRMSLSGISLAGYVNKENTSYNSNTKAGDSRQKHSGMTALFNAKAFTLIELLVVVLIVGILAAVAVPQYNLAVAKSRLNGLLPIGKSVAQAEEVYYLENAKYTLNWDVLSVDVAGEKGTTSQQVIYLPNGTITLGSSGVSVHPNKVGGAYIYFFYRNISHSFAGKQSCYASMNNDFANKVCQMLTNRKTPSSNNGPDTYNIYHFKK